MIECPTCGSPIGEGNLILEVGGIVVYRCPLCGREQGATVSYIQPEFFDDTRVRVTIRWAGAEASARELIGLRHVVPEFQNLRLAEVRARVASADRWLLGEFPRPYALHELASAAKENGLLIEFNEIA